jgi:hypothetical protein
MDEDVELDAERRQYVTDVFARLDALDHYEILGLRRGADKRSIKRAYFELARVIHPDRYFGKNLGAYRPKLEAIFTRATKAYETLSDPAAKVSYDATLPAAAAKAGPAPAAPIAPRASGAAPAAPAAPEAPAAPARPAAPVRPVDAKAAARRAEALAALQKHLAGSQDRAKVHAEAAARALAAGDLTTAVTEYREAVRLAPKDEALRKAAEAAERTLGARRAEADRRQARLEEQHEHWAEAAASWRRVAAAVPEDVEARVHLHAAEERLTAADRQQAHLAEAQGRWAEAEAAWRRVAAILPQDVEARARMNVAAAQAARRRPR